MENLEKYKLGDIPSIYYIPDYLTIKEEELLMQNIYQATKWTQLSNRRLQNHGGIPNEKGMLQQPLPKYLMVLNEKIQTDFDIFPKVPNHVLINEYKVNQGILPHRDGPIYEPMVASISLGSSVLIEFKKDSVVIPILLEEIQCSVRSPQTLTVIPILLEPRSLIVFTDDIYQEYMHGIQENEEFVVPNDVLNGIHVGETVKRDLRISLTIRLVKKTIKNILKL
jgi:alkylated DNA repair protein alkB family protein 6